MCCRHRRRPLRHHLGVSANAVQPLVSIIRDAFGSPELLILLAIYVAELIFFIRKRSNFGWWHALLTSLVIGVTTGPYLCFLAIVVFGWPGATLVVLLLKGLQLYGKPGGALIGVGAYFSASIFLAIVAFLVALLMAQPPKILAMLKVRKARQASH